MARPLPGVPADIPNRLHLLYLILKRIKEETDPKFIEAIKINSSDFVQGGEPISAGYAGIVVVELMNRSGRGPSHCNHQRNRFLEDG